jgi:hypothetical protein
MRFEILRDPWSIGVVCVHGTEGDLGGDCPDGERRGVEGGKRGPSRLSTQCRRRFRRRERLCVDRGAVWDGRHAYDAWSVCRASRSWHVQPHARFEVDVDRVGSVASSSNGVGNILNGLEVRQATEKDVALVVEVQATVGDLANRSSKGQLLSRQVEFQDVVVCTLWRCRNGKGC